MVPVDPVQPQFAAVRRRSCRVLYFFTLRPYTGVRRPHRARVDRYSTDFETTRIKLHKLIRFEGQEPRLWTDEPKIGGWPVGHPESPHRRAHYELALEFCRHPAGAALHRASVRRMAPTLLAATNVSVGTCHSGILEFLLSSSGHEGIFDDVDTIDDALSVRLYV